MPDELAQRVRAIAAATNRRLEDVLVDCIGRAVAEPVVESVTDDEILVLYDARMDVGQQEELSDLLARHRENQLQGKNRVRLDELMHVYRHGMVLRPRAMKEAVTRGLRPVLSEDAA